MYVMQCKFVEKEDYPFGLGISLNLKRKQNVHVIQDRIIEQNLFEVYSINLKTHLLN